MEKTCNICQQTQSIGYFSSFWIWSESKEEMVEYHRGECRSCYAPRYQKKGKTFGVKLTIEEEDALREIWPSHRTESLASIHRDAGLKMGYPTFLKYCRAGSVEKWYRCEE
jgi:hypothetical protein